MQKIKIEPKLIQKIAGLSKLSVTDSEAKAFANEFESILEYAAQISEVDTSDIEESHHLDNFSSPVLAEDNPNKELIPRSSMLQNATDGRENNGYIVTSSVLSDN